MQETVKIEGGFAEVGAGTWLMGRGQPAAFFGSAVRRRRKGFFLRDRSVLDLVETTGVAKCADARRPFLTHIPCAAPISAASAKVLVAPAAARTGAEVVKMIPMSLKGSLCVTVFGENWVVMATASRICAFGGTRRLYEVKGRTVAEDETLAAATDGGTDESHRLAAAHQPRARPDFGESALYLHRLLHHGSLLFRFSSSSFSSASSFARSALACSFQSRISFLSRLFSRLRSNWRIFLPCSISALRRFR